MNDLATLKSLTNIKPIATLGNAPADAAPFNKFVFERVSNYGSVQNGIVLTINDDAHEDVEEWSEFITDIKQRVTVRRTVTDDDLQSLSLHVPAIHKYRELNYAMMLSEDAAIFRFVTARWQGQTYTIKELNTYFSKLRRAYHLSDQAGVIDVSLRLGSVNHTYTSRQQIEEVLYPMAYTFFREDTEL